MKKKASFHVCENIYIGICSSADKSVCECRFPELRLFLSCQVQTDQFKAEGTFYEVMVFARHIVLLSRHHALLTSCV